MIKHGITFLFLLLSNLLFAGDLDSSFHSNGKINVVIGVVLIIFIAIIIYLFLIDRKLKRIEKNLNDKS